MAKQTFTTGQVLTAAQMTSLQQTAMGGGSTTAKTASYVLVAADAGTVVQMNAAGATTITVNTALFAAGDSVQIQNVGAGVCTVTAGTATVSTSATLALKQYDAGSLYFNTTSAAIFFAVDAADGMANVLTTTGDMVYSSSGSTAARLGIGSSAQVLTVAGGIPSWATPSSGAQSFTKIATSSFSGVATTTTTFDGVFTSTYKKYLVIMSEMVCSSTSAVLYLQVRTAAVTGATSYYGSSISVNSGGTTRSELSSNASQWGIARQSDTLKSSYNFYFTTVGNASEKPSASCQGVNNYDNGGQVFGGLRDSATTVDGFILSASTGNISGTATIFGIVN